MRNRYLLPCDVPIAGMAAYGAFALRFDWYARQSRSEFLPYLIALNNQRAASDDGYGNG